MAKKATAVEVKEVKVEETKVVKAAETKAAETKTAAKKDTTKKATAAKKETTAKKAPAAKKEATVDVFVQFAGNQVSYASVEERVKAAFVAEGHRASSIKNLKIYIKPEENAAYYVINEDNVGRVDLFA